MQKTTKPSTVGTMILYASQTHGTRNLNALQENGFRILVTPDTYRGEKSLYWKDGTKFPYAMDNGAYGCHLRNEDFNFEKFEKMVLEAGEGADWVVAPDIVGGGLASLEMSVSWRKHYDGRALIAVQDGMRPKDVVNLLGPRTGIAVGGTTEWKLRNLPIWGKCASRAGCYLHILRVNSRKRLHACRIAGAHSTDGTNATIFSVKAPRMAAWADEAERQKPLGIWK